MSVYNTKQRKVLLEFLSNHPDEIFSATQIIDYFKNEKISLSAVYRNLSELEALGEIKKINKNGTREAYYQYIQAETCQNQIHLFCEKCEKLTHMNSRKAQNLSTEILEDVNFEINKKNTIIYGICKNCR